MRQSVAGFRSSALAVAAAAVAVGIACGTARAEDAAKGGKLSEKSVTILMDYAWQILPAKFTSPAGKLIEVDKKKRAENIVPVETGRDVIRAAYNSAQAQICELWEEQQLNFDTLMRREIAKKKWTDQQLLYITTLHRMTIHAVAGKLRVEDKDGTLKVFLEPIKPGEGKCPDDKKTQVREAIKQYVGTDAPPAPTPAAAKAPPAAPKK